MLDLKELPVPAYLVGGWVRDRLIQNQNSANSQNPIPELIHKKIKYLDLDFVLPNRAVETAKAIAKKHQAGFVLLDKDRQIARVVFNDGTADFAQQSGNSITADLSHRDFAMNAIAIDCQKITAITQTDLPEFIDPFDGQDDINLGIIRMVAPENLRADPLRILRAYRQAAQLEFTIEALTYKYLIEISPLLKNIAAERVRTEISYLLALGQVGTQWLALAINDGVLKTWLPPQNLIMSRFALVDQAILEIIEQWQALASYFANILSSDHTVAVIVKLTAMSSSATALKNLGFSRLEQRWIMTLLRFLPEFLGYLSSNSASRSQQYQLFAATQEIFPALAVIAAACGQSWQRLAPWLNRWLDPEDPLAHPTTILNGDDLKTELNLSSGIQIGVILDQLKLAQAEEIIVDRAGAIIYAQSLISNS